MRNRYLKLKWKLLATSFRRGKITVRKLWNVLVCSSAYFLRLKKSGPAPFILSLELTNECTANCLFCRDAHGVIHDINTTNPSPAGILKGEMPLAMAQEAIEQLADDLLIVVLYTNGEPLLYKELESLVRFCSSHKVLCMIATNGQLLTPEKSRQLLEAGIDFIKVQLSGFTQPVYSVEVRNGSVERVKEHLRTLASLRDQGRFATLVMADYILYQYNREELPLFQAFCQELNIMLNTRPGNPKGGLEGREPELPAEPLPLPLCCDWLWEGMQINFQGDILPCCDAVIYSNYRPFWTYRLGERNLRVVWNGPAAQQMRQTIARKGRGSYSLCAQCQRKGVAFKW